MSKEKNPEPEGRIVCLNCGFSFQSHFCPQCGQKASTGPITLHKLLEEIPNAIFHVNSGFLFNCYYLLIQPGKTIRDYLAGKRKKFFHPATFLLLALVINYLVVKLHDLHFYDVAELAIMDPLKAKAIMEYDAMQWWFLEHTYLYILIAIPASSVFLFFLFRMLKQNINLAESAVVVLFIIAEGVLLQSSVYLLTGWLDSGPVIRTMESVNLIMLISYASFALFELVRHSTNYLKWTGAVLGGLGLATVWIASGYLLYILSS